MTRYKPFDPNTEVTGASALAFITNVNHADMTNILRKYNLDTIDPQQWYAQDAILNVYSDISERVNASMNFVAIGVAVADLGVKNLPPHMLTISLIDFFIAYGAVYQSRHRNGDAGYIKAERVDDSHIVFRFKTPYPDDFIYGTLYGYARNLLQANQHFTMSYDKSLKRYEQGGDETVLHLHIK